jgi:hypothetical protein
MARRSNDNRVGHIPHGGQCSNRLNAKEERRTYHGGIIPTTHVDDKTKRDKATKEIPKRKRFFFYLPSARQRPKTKAL